MNATNKKKVIEVENLNFNFENTLALSNISFSLNEGDFLAIVGPNGSGKTTLIKLLLGIYKQKKGIIKIFGKNISKFSKFGQIGYVPQKATHFDINFPASVSEIVQMGLLANKKFPKTISANDKVMIKKMLKKVDMEKYAKKRIGELSGGQQQRVLIAKALISNPKIIFLDEPATGIDQNTQCKFYKMLKKLNDEGITIVLISHDIGRITKYVTKIASLNQTLQFYGSHKEFCAWDKDHQHNTSHSHKLCHKL